MRRFDGDGVVLKSLNQPIFGGVCVEVFIISDNSKSCSRRECEQFSSCHVDDSNIKGKTIIVVIANTFKSEWESFHRGACIKLSNVQLISSSRAVYNSGLLLNLNPCTIKSREKFTFGVLTERSEYNFNMLAGVFFQKYPYTLHMSEPDWLNQNQVAIYRMTVWYILACAKGESYNAMCRLGLMYNLDKGCEIPDQDTSIVDDSTDTGRSLSDISNCPGVLGIGSPQSISENSNNTSLSCEIFSENSNKKQVSVSGAKVLLSPEPSPKRVKKSLIRDVTEVDFASLEHDLAHHTRNFSISQEQDDRKLFQAKNMKIENCNAVSSEKSAYSYNSTKQKIDGISQKSSVTDKRRELNHAWLSLSCQTTRETVSRYRVGKRKLRTYKKPPKLTVEYMSLHDSIYG